MANEVKILLANESPLFTLESITNLIFKQSCDRVTNLVKYYIMLGGNERRPKRDAFGKRSFPSEARSAKKKQRPLLYVSRCYSSAVITFSGIPWH